jgi:ABC-type transport system involved in multi-copper enzyme maturation permease subunit
MNQTIVIHTALERALSAPRVLLAFAVVTFPALLLSVAPGTGLQVLESGTFLGLILGAGLIGQEVSSGVLQLLFARPVTRTEFILSRWFGAAACASAAALLEIALGTTVMALRGVHTPLDQIGTLALEQTLGVFGVVSVLALLSSVLPGIGDLMSWIVMTAMAGVLQVVGQLMRSGALIRASVEWGRFLNPSLHLHDAMGGGTSGWFIVASYFSTVTLCLALAIMILNRREFSYATE